MRSFELFTILLLTLSLPVWSQKSSATIVYVNIEADGANNGSSWTNGYTNLQDALNDPRATEIWVSQGIYTAPKGGFLIDGFGATGKVLGGFIGNETSVDQRDIDQNNTVLEVNIDASSSLVITSTTKDNDISFDGFIVQTSSAIETVSQALNNIELTNGWINNESFDNSDEFANIGDQNTDIHNQPISQIADKAGSTSLLQGDLFEIHPTTTTSIITITAPKGSTIELINYLGEMVKRQKMMDETLILDISNQTKGLYIVKLITPEKRIKTERIFLN